MKPSRTASAMQDRKTSSHVGQVAPVPSLLTDQDIHLFNEGTHYRLFDKLGAHVIADDATRGTCFAVWAPNARKVSVMGDFNEWSTTAHELYPRGESGIWEGFIPGVEKGALYKYHIVSQVEGYRVDKPDPFGFYYEPALRGASIVWPLDTNWGDGQWMADRRARNAIDAPISIYEVHLGSWRRVPEDLNRSLSYRELADQLTEYVVRMGFTHVEFMPLMEHPYYGSWGYQATGFYAPTSRYGSPQDLMHLIDRLHQADVGVIFDWIPSHFATDEHGLRFFDGTHLFEHADPRQGRHPDWDSYIFNYGRNEIRSFLISSAKFWLERYHADGLRVDAVASMLYLDYSRTSGQWIPNKFGGRENLEAIDFLRTMNEEIYKEHPDVQTFAEESTSWPMVARPTYVGGLGFGFKWDMGWMHDTLGYMRQDPVHRRYHQDKLTFRMMYAFSENFTLPLSHDEVVHGKGSLLAKMSGGDDWQKFANLRLLYGYMYAQPGKKLLFMGAEFGQRGEWNHDASLDWHLLDAPNHAQLRTWVSHLNDLYRREPALHVRDVAHEGFEWVDCSDNENSVISFQRKGTDPDDILLFVFNFTPVPRYNYRIGVPHDGWWDEILNSDAQDYGGSGQGNLGGVEAAPVAAHNQHVSLTLTLPPLGMIVCKPSTEKPG